MLFIRSFAYFIGMAVSACIISIVSVCLFFLPLRTRYTLLSSWQRFCLWWLRITCSIHFHIIGREHIPTTPCVIISNHQSTLDILFLPLILPMHTGVLKKQLLYIPFFGWGLVLMKPIVIDRTQKLKSLKKVITTGVKRLQQGIFVIIYPEGTRKNTTLLGEYQNGAVMMAKQAEVPVVPIAHNAGTVWKQDHFIKYPGVVTIIIGEPITEIDSVKNTTQEIYDWTKQQLQSLAVQ